MGTLNWMKAAVHQDFRYRIEAMLYALAVTTIGDPNATAQHKAIATKILNGIVNIAEFSKACCTDETLRGLIDGLSAADAYDEINDAQLRDAVIRTIQAFAAASM